MNISFFEKFRSQRTIQTVKSWESHAAEVTEASLERISRALKIPTPFFEMKNDPHKELADLK